MFDSIYEPKQPAGHMIKWWKTYHPVDGLVLEHVSPYAYRPAASFFSHLPASINRYIRPTYILPRLVGLGTPYLVAQWGKSKYAADQKALRP
jgi:hypothetical protein